MRRRVRNIRFVNEITMTIREDEREKSVNGRAAIKRTAATENAIIFVLDE